ncbi:MAG: lytic murein transglycosylase, partial [Bradyrhizobium sp.]|nr:lytic murein transglycosylase [Bradyrhizobium sp.]
MAAALFVCAQGSAVRAESSFGSWRARLWVEAQARGIEQSTFDRAMDVQVDLSLPDLVIPGRPVKEQAEFVKLPSDYLPAGQLSSLARQGRQLLLKNRLLLDRIEAEFGVPGNVVIAIWG